MKKTGRYAALLRGVNLGRAKKVAMSDLRAALERAGYRDFRTLLNSGNVVFSAGVAGTQTIAAHVEKTILSELGVSTRVTVLAANELAEVMQENPLLEYADNPSRLHVAFFRDPSAGTRLQALAAERWEPDILAVGRRAGYMWVPNGMSNSTLPLAVDKLLRDDVTVRTWGTVTKIRAATESV